MDWNQVIQGIIIIVGSIFSGSLVFLGIRLGFFSDKAEYEVNKKITGSIINPIKGKVNTNNDSKRSYRTAAGLAINTVNNTWEDQGKLSKEAIDSVLR